MLLPHDAGQSAAQLADVSLPVHTPSPQREHASVLNEQFARQESVPIAPAPSAVAHDAPSRSALSHCSPNSCTALPHTVQVSASNWQPAHVSCPPVKPSDAHVVVPMS